jgi:sec-independent protein translocase protein TatC
MHQTTNHPTGHTMSFGDHLDELRKRLLLAIAAPLPLFIVLFFFSDTLLEWVLLPVFDQLSAQGLPASVQVLSPPEFLLTKLKLSGITALVISCPWVIYQMWAFIAPGLYQRERRFVYFLMPGSAILTVAGVALLYFVMLPLMLHVLIVLARDVDVGSGPEPSPAAVRVLAEATEIPNLTAPPAEPRAGDAWLEVPGARLFVAVADEDADEAGAVRIERVHAPAPGIDQTFRVSWVVSFTLVLMLGIVVAFQMPLVIVLLGWMGIASAPWLRSRRRYALAVCGIVAAVITPADAVSMVIMLIPLYGLYELGIVLLVLFPASAVAEGRLRFSRRSEKRSSAKAGEAAQPGATVPRTGSSRQADSEKTDSRSGD